MRIHTLTLAPNRGLLDILSSVNFKADIEPHLLQCSGELVWCGPFDRHNRAPIGSTACGLKVHVVQMLGLCYEVALNEHASITTVVASCLTNTGGLRKYGASNGYKSFPEDVDPRTRRFGVMGRVNSSRLATCTYPLEHKISAGSEARRLVLRLRRAADALNTWASVKSMTRPEDAEKLPHQAFH